MSGITTSILSTRLKNYSESQGFNDEFIPCRIGSSNDLLESVDIILLAPQAEAFYNAMKERNNEFKGTVLMLDEQMFVTGKPEDIYSYIKSNVKGEIIYSEQTIKLTLKLLCQIVVESFILCSPIIIFGVVAYFLSFIRFFSFAYVLFEATIGFMSVYLAYAIGFKYGAFTNSNSYVMGLLTFATSMMINNGFDAQAKIYASLSNDGIIQIIFLIIQDTLSVSFFSVLTILLLEILRNSFKINFKANQQSVLMINQSIVFGFIFLVFLIIRFIFIR